MNTLCIQADVYYLHARVAWSLLRLQEDGAMTAALWALHTRFTLQCRVHDDRVGDLFKLRTVGRAGKWHQNERLSNGNAILTLHYELIRGDIPPGYPPLGYTGTSGRCT